MGLLVFRALVDGTRDRLPMARIYASYFGGSIDLVTLPGHGTDVFIKFRALDESTNLTL